MNKLISVIVILIGGLLLSSVSYAATLIDAVDEYNRVYPQSIFAQLNEDMTDYLLDGDLSTSYCYQSSYSLAHDQTPEIEMNFTGVEQLGSIWIRFGNQKSEHDYWTNARPAIVTLKIITPETEPEYRFLIEDQYNYWSNNAEWNNGYQALVLPQVIDHVACVKIYISSWNKGSRNENTVCISDLVLSKSKVFPNSVGNPLFQNNDQFGNNLPYDIGVPNIGNISYEMGSHNINVYWVQVQLKTIGYYIKYSDGVDVFDETGVLGSITADAIREFQRDYGLQQTGVISQQLINQIRAVQNSHYIYPTPVMIGGYYDYLPNLNGEGIEADAYGCDVRWVQKCLNYLGYNCGQPDGSYGIQTQQQFLKFKRDNGFYAEGTTIKLGHLRLMMELFIARGFDPSNLY